VDAVALVDEVGLDAAMEDTRASLRTVSASLAASARVTP